MALLVISGFLQFVNGLSGSINRKELLLEELIKLGLDSNRKSICDRLFMEKDWLSLTI